MTDEQLSDEAEATVSASSAELSARTARRKLELTEPDQALTERLNVHSVSCLREVRDLRGGRETRSSLCSTDRLERARHTWRSPLFAYWRASLGLGPHRFERDRAATYVAMKAAMPRGQSWATRIVI
ncbi:hypothetical protein GCM10010206_00530 [Streptomyces cinerochromogenes]|nr:hypothetical protein GCM10010206_00530 [Streptomyces cinerochromogenes]